MKPLLRTALPFLLVATHAMACTGGDDGAPLGGDAEPVARHRLPLWSAQQQLTADAADDRFSASVHIDGDTAVVGAPRGNDRRGTVYLFARIDGLWAEQQQLAPDDLASGAFFGTSVALEGDALVVGAPRDGAGVVYVFTRDGETWAQTQRLAPSDGAPSDHFGTAVDLHGDTLLVGSLRHDSAGMDAGAAYVFTRTSSDWVEHQKLTASAPGEEAFFGGTVAVGEDVLLVAAPLDEVQGPDSGAVFAFGRDGDDWVERQTLRPLEDWRVGAQFGHALSLDGDHVLIGSPGEWSPQSSAGAAYTFQRIDGSWVPRFRIVGPVTAGDRFGSAVSLAGKRAVIGASGDDTLGEHAGVAYTYSNTGSWSFDEMLMASDGGGFDQFGSSTAMSGTTVWVGAPADRSAGTVYTYRVTAPCTDPTDCASGFCVDGQCCDTACGGGTDDDCQACNLLGSEGTCRPIAPQTCRPAGSECDVAEMCDGMALECPADDHIEDGTTCQSATGVCDAGVCAPADEPVADDRDADATPPASCTAGGRTSPSWLASLAAFALAMRLRRRSARR